MERERERGLNRSPFCGKNQREAWSPVEEQAMRESSERPSGERAGHRGAAKMKGGELRV